MNKSEKKAALARVKLTNPAHLFALGFGTGLSPVMPGTFGTLAAIPFILLFPYLSLSLQLLLTIAVCLVGFWLCEKTAKDMQVHDHPAIVWDEVAGMMITMLAVPVTVTNLVAGFLLFRLLDIAKPWPIRFFDKQVHGGVGIMLDDIIAGVFALGILQALIYLNLLQF